MNFTREEIKLLYSQLSRDWFGYDERGAKLSGLVKRMRIYLEETEKLETTEETN